MDNLILATDSYKLNHWAQYPKGTERVYSYFETRKGATYPDTVFFGLQYLLKRYLVGSVVNYPQLEEAATLARAHFGKAGVFNYHGWSHLIKDHNGELPLRIKAVPEGTPVPTGNVMMTVENTCDQCFWLTNAVESLLTHVWYPSTVATLSRHTIERIGNKLDETAGSRDGLPFMLHDFGYRGASSHETAAIGGAAHLVNSLGTDTLPGMLTAMKYYDAKLDDLAFSVPATEHSVMTAQGKEGEMDIVDQLLDEYPEGILSVVADSYDIYDFVNALGGRFKDRILARDGVFVVRPDSVTFDHPTPEDLVAWISWRLWKDFGGTDNAKGFKVLNPKVRILWGDGIDPKGIGNILATASANRFSAENYVFGMGGGLLQKVNRDTQRFAFKCSAQRRDGRWHDVYKVTPSKNSKRGRLALVEGKDGLETVQVSDGVHGRKVDDLLVPVFENGKILNEITFDQVRANAKG